MSPLDTLLERYKISLVEALSVTGLGEQIIGISMSSLNSLSKYMISHEAKSSHDNQIAMLGRLYNSDALSHILPIIYRQQTVLLISILEAFLSDVVRIIGSDYRKIIIWPEGKDKKGVFDMALLESDAVTIGDLVLGIIEQRGISFQDLKSTKDFYSQYLSIELSVGAEHEERLILGAATRHIIVHNGSRVDRKFMRQIRDTSYRDKFAEGQLIAIKLNELKLLTTTLDKFGAHVILKLNEKLKVNP